MVDQCIAGSGVAPVLSLDGGLAHVLYQLLLLLLPPARSTACRTEHDTEYRTTVLQCATTCFGNYWLSTNEQSRGITEGTEAFTLSVIFIFNRD